MFDEFKYFTKTPSSYSSNAAYTPNFRASKITLPPQVKSIQQVGIGAGSTRKVVINEGMLTMKSGLRGIGCYLLDVSSTVTLFSPYVGYQVSNLTVIMRPTTPPATDNSYPAQFKPVAIYVPDESLDLYIESSYWATWKTKFKPLSEYTG